VMTKTEHVYVMYIAATPKRIFDAIVQPEFARQYWFHENISDWKPGSKWEHRDPTTGEVKITGKVVECDPPKRLVFTWTSPKEASDPDSYSRVTFEIEPVDELVRLTVTHDQLIPGSPMEKGINNGWPPVPSGLKTFLQHGKPP